MKNCKNIAQIFFTVQNYSIRTSISIFYLNTKVLQMSLHHTKSTDICNRYGMNTKTRILHHEKSL